MASEEQESFDFALSAAKRKHKEESGVVDWKQFQGKIQDHHPQSIRKNYLEASQEAQDERTALNQIDL